MRKVLTLFIISGFIFIVINLKNLKNVIDFNEEKIKHSKFSFFKKENN